MFAVVCHCKHAPPIGPCPYCLDSDDPSRSQPRTIAYFDWADIAQHGATNRNAGQPRWSSVAFTVVEV